jgi:hypothetical protein
VDSIPVSSGLSNKSPAKRRRNASNVWNYIDKASRKCSVEKYAATFSKNSATTSLIYHLNSDHKIIVNDETLLNCDSDDEVSSQNKNSQTSNSHEGGSQAGGSQAGGSQAGVSKKESIRRKFGTLEQSKRDAALLVRT